VKHGAIPDAESSGWVRRIEDGLHILTREVSDKARIGFFCRNGQNTPDLL
jgi:hypothetical protein